ncbi:M15 family metallopeptidase [Turicibacter bilis]|nr:M15 family metallopeptidase [Turicibacter bilis]UUF12054.1 M15 family metallopeptidase [Turicibacter bilis]
MIKFGSLSGLFIITIGISLSKNITIFGESRQDSVGKPLSSQSFNQTNQAAIVANLDQLAKEKLLEEERLAEEKRQEEERLAEEKRLEQQPAKLDLESSFYENVITVSNGDSKLVLVNKNYALDSSYAPSDLVLPNVLALGHEQNKTIYLREEASQHLEQLFSAAEQEAGLIFLARSGYRSYETQVSLYQRYVDQNGQEAADRFSARAGHSEHQTGLAIDVTADSVNGQLTTEFGKTAEGIWLKDNAHRFGYIIRYLEGRESETGYQYEPWHIRYVGVEAATEIYQNNWILEQYLNK